MSMFGEEIPMANQQLLQLLAGAKTGNKNLSGLLGNMDNPLLLAIAGVLDPMYGSGSTGATPLMSQYANSEEPVIQDIISKVQQGVDPYALNSYIDTLVSTPNADMASFQVEDLKGLARGMANEWSKSSSNANNVFAKAGFRHPSDVYSTADMPMEDYATQAILKSAQNEQAQTKGYDAAKQNATKALLAFQNAPKYEGRKVRDTARQSQISKFIKDEQGLPLFLVRDNALDAFKKWYDKNRQASISEIQGKYEELQRTTGTNPRLSGLGDVVKKIKKTSSSVENLGPEADTSMTAYDAAQRAKIKPESVMSNEFRLRQAIANNQMKGLAEKGRTPFTDQVNALAKYIGGIK